MADGVDAAMDAVQAAGANPPLHGLGRYPDIEELRPRDHSLLGGRDGNYGLIGLLYNPSRPKFAHTGECGPFFLTDL
jgi:hypothetical protein